MLFLRFVARELVRRLGLHAHGEKLAQPPERRKPSASSDTVKPVRESRFSSWPGLSRPSTPFRLPLRDAKSGTSEHPLQGQRQPRRVDGRDKPGHDGGGCLLRVPRTNAEFSMVYLAERSARGIRSQGCVKRHRLRRRPSSAVLEFEFLSRIIASKPSMASRRRSRREPRTLASARKRSGLGAGLSERLPTEAARPPARLPDAPAYAMALAWLGDAPNSSFSCDGSASRGWRWSSSSPGLSRFTRSRGLSRR